MLAMKNDLFVIASAILISLHPSMASAAESVRSIDIVEASAFLEQYRGASEAQRTEFYDLYSDRAVVHARVQGREQGVAFQGRAFKGWGRELLKEGKTGLDGSIFRDATVEQRGNRLIVRAKRYSTTRCYWDPAYEVGIEREGAAFRIVDERLTTNPTVLCLSAHNSAGISLSTTYAATDPLAVMSGAPSRGADSTGGREWHPLSEQELADKSMRLAQQLAGARASLPSSENVTSPSVIATGALPRSSSRGSAAAEQGDVAISLRITPQD